MLNVWRNLWRHLWKRFCQSEGLTFTGLLAIVLLYTTCAISLLDRFTKRTSICCSNHSFERQTWSKILWHVAYAASERSVAKGGDRARCKPCRTEGGLIHRWHGFVSYAKNEEPFGLYWHDSKIYVCIVRIRVRWSNHRVKDIINICHFRVSNLLMFLKKQTSRFPKKKLWIVILRLMILGQQNTQQTYPGNLDNKQKAEHPVTNLVFIRILEFVLSLKKHALAPLLLQSWSTECDLTASSAYASVSNCIRASLVCLDVQRSGDYSNIDNEMRPLGFYAVWV